MKKGDYFVDDNRTLVVDEILPDGNYLSHVVSVGEFSPYKEEKPKARKKKEKVNEKDLG